MKIVRVVAVLIVVEFPFAVPLVALEIEAPAEKRMMEIN
jgi:hypothetical protein